MSNSCCSCSRNITGTRYKGVQCNISGCKKFFHVKCIDVNGDFDESLENGSFVWSCPSCKSEVKTAINMENVASKVNTPSAVATIDDVQRCINDLSTRFGSLEGSQQFCANIMEKLRIDFNTAIDEIKSLKNQITIAQEECKSLRYRVNKLEALNDCAVQQKLVNNIVIDGVPSNNFDNTEVVMNVLSTVVPTFDKSLITDIIKIKRDNLPLSTASSTTISSFSTKNDKYIVKLLSLETKSKILEKMKSLKMLSTDNLNINFNTPKPSRIFIMHNLSAYQTFLYKEAKQIKQQLNFRFLWIRDGVIMLRQDVGKKAFHIRSPNNLEDIRRTLQST